MSRFRPPQQGWLGRRGLLQAAPAALLGPLAGEAAIDVTRLGAAGDGRADDWPAIQRAIDSAQAAGGGIVLCPTGRYRLSRSLRVTAGGVTLAGAGPAATTLLPDAALEGDVVAFDGDDAGLQHGGVQALTIAAAQPRAAGAGIHLHNASHLLVQDVDLDGMHVGCLIDGFGVRQHVERGYWTNTSPGGVALWIDAVADLASGHGANDQFISHLVIDNPEDVSRQPYAGIRLRNSQSAWLADCDVLSCRYGLAIDPQAPSPPPDGGPPGTVTWLFAHGCAFDTCAERGISVEPAPGSVCRGLSFAQCWSSSTLKGDGCVIAGPVDGVQLSGHRFLANEGYGLVAYGPAANVRVDGCVAAGNRLDGFAFMQCADFAVQHSRSGAALGFGVSQPRGIAVGRGCRSYVVSGNALGGNVQRGLLDEGSAPKVVAENL